MSENKVKWHPYPKEKPETYRYCFVTIETRDRKSKKKIDSLR